MMQLKLIAQRQRMNDVSPAIVGMSNL